MDRYLDVIIPAFFIISFVAMMAGGLAWANRRLKAARQAARDLAAACGLEYRDGGMDMVDSTGAPAGIAAATAKLPAFIRNFIERSAPWRLTGERDGQRIEVYPETRSSGRSTTTWIILRVRYRKPLSFDIKIAREGFLAKIGKALSIAKDIETGDPDFDPQIRVKAADESSAAALLSDPGRRSSLLALIRAYPDAYAGREHIHWERQGDRMDSSELESLLSLVVPAAKAMVQ